MTHIDIERKRLAEYFDFELEVEFEPRLLVKFSQQVHQTHRPRVGWFEDLQHVPTHSTILNYIFFVASVSIEEWKSNAKHKGLRSGFGLFHDSKTVTEKDTEPKDIESASEHLYGSTSIPESLL